MSNPGLRLRSANSGITAWVLASVLLHGGLVGGIVYAQSLRPPAIDLSKAIPVQLVQLGEQRDPRLLPRKPVTPPPPPPAEVEPPRAPPTAPPPAPEPAENAVPLKTSEDKEPEKKPPEKKPPPPPKLSAAAERLLRGSGDGRLDDAMAKLEKAEGSPDGSRYGTTTDPNQAAQGYQREVAAALKAVYVVPAPIPSAQRRFLKARVVLFIDRNGRIKKYDFAERHSNKLFMSALEKLLKTVKLPKPPASLRRQVANDGIVVIFSP